jgi:hypothetical protein
MATPSPAPSLAPLHAAFLSILPRIELHARLADQAATEPVIDLGVGSGSEGFHGPCPLFQTLPDFSAGGLAVIASVGCSTAGNRIQII